MFKYDIKNILFLNGFIPILNCFCQTSEEYLKRGIAHVNLHLYREAVEDFNKAIAINPNYLEAYYSKRIAQI